MFSKDLKEARTGAQAVSVLTHCRFGVVLYAEGSTVRRTVYGSAVAIWYYSLCDEVSQVNVHKESLIQ